MSTKSPKKDKDKTEPLLTRTKSVIVNTRTLRRKEGSLKKISEMTQMLLTPINELTPKVKTKRSPKEKPVEKRDLDKAKRVKQPALGQGQGGGEVQGQVGQKRRRGRKRKADLMAESPEKPESPKKPPASPPQGQLLGGLQREVSMAELIQIAEQRSLDEEDFMEILTCDSPVWWEDPPTDAYTEDPIFPMSLYADHYEDMMRCNNAASPVSIGIPQTKQIDYKFMKKRCKLEHLLGNIKNKKNNINSEEEHKNNDKGHKNIKIEQNEKKHKNNNKNTQNEKTIKNNYVSDSESTKSLIEVKSPEICNEGANTFTEHKEKRSREEISEEINVKEGKEEPEDKRSKKCSESTEDDSIIGFHNEDLLRDLENMDIPIESENESEIARAEQLKELNSDAVSCTSQDIETENIKNTADTISESSTHCDTSETDDKTGIEEKNLIKSKETPLISQGSAPDVVSVASTITYDTVSDTIHSSSPTNLPDSVNDNDSRNSAEYTNSQKSEGEERCNSEILLQSQDVIAGSENSNSENGQNDNTTEKPNEFNNIESNKSDNESKPVTENGSNSEDVKDSTKEVKTKKLNKEQFMAVYKTLIGFGEVNNMDKDKKKTDDNANAVVVTDKNAENVTTYYKKCKNTKRAMKNGTPDKETQYENENIGEQEPIQETNPKNFNEREIKEQNIDNTEQSVDDKEINRQKIDNKEITEHNIGHTEILEQNIGHTEIIQQNIDETVIMEQNIDHTETIEQTTDDTEITEQNISEPKLKHIDVNVIEQEITDDNEIAEEVINANEIEEEIIDSNAIDEEILDDNAIEEEMIDDNAIEEEMINNNEFDEDIIDHNETEEKLIYVNGIEQKIIDDNKIEEEIIDNNEIEEKLIYDNEIEEKFIDENKIEEEIIDNNEIEEKLIYDNEIEEKISDEIEIDDQSNTKNIKQANFDDKGTKNENYEVKNKCCNCNKFGDGRSIRYIIPDGKSAKYCLKCSSIFETETCCYCEKILQSETPCASCKAVI